MLSLHYEARLGLARGAIYRDGLPHLYMEGYEFDPSPGVLGTRSVARVTGAAGGVRFIVLADSTEAVLDAPQGAKLTDGAAVEVEIIAEARRGKRVRAAYAGPAEGAPRRLSKAVSLKDRLVERAAGLIGGTVMEVKADRDRLDDARDQALNPSGALKGGGDLAIEATRGLIACDVDAGGEGGLQTPRAHARACNERAVADLPRRLRLSNLAGLVVVDLIGQRHDGEVLRRLLLDNFAAEAARIVVAPIGRFGTLECVRPWGAHPLYAASPLAVAVDLTWRAIELSEQDAGRPIAVRATADVLDLLRPLRAASLDPMVPMLRLEESSRLETVYA